MSDLEFGGFQPGENPPENQQGNEKAAEAREAQREAFQKAAAALAGVKKDEKKTKKREKSLAALLSLFIKESEGQDDVRIINTLVFLLKEDVPAEFVMGVLALMYPTLRAVILESTESDDMAMQQYQENAKILTLLHSPRLVLQTASDFDHDTLPDEVKSEINTWVQILLTSISFHPEWILPKVFPEKRVHSLCVQLGSIVLEKFLGLYNIQGDFVKIRSFTQYILQGVLQKISSQTEQGQLMQGK